MDRTTLLPLLLVAVVGGAAPAPATDANGSSEQKKVQRSCSAPADPHFSAPGAGDCAKAGGTCTATHYTNVQCGDKNAVAPANPPAPASTRARRAGSAPAPPAASPPASRAVRI